MANFDSQNSTKLVLPGGLIPLAGNVKHDITDGRRESFFERGITEARAGLRRWCNEQQRVSSFVLTDGTIEA